MKYTRRFVQPVQKILIFVECFCEYCYNVRLYAVFLHSQAESAKNRNDYWL